jgi:MtrB/PioB family decaheme-associated outer membrane protein
MNKSQGYPFQRKVLAVAVQAAVLAIIAAPAANATDVDPLVQELTSIDRSVEVGIINTSKDSFKFGEYNGLQDKGAHAALGFKLGGKGNDENSALRWTAEGTDLGLDTRRFEVQGGQQGLFNLNFLYDELPHQITDTYKTIFNGAGSNALTLPAAYPAIGTRISSTTSDANALANWANIQSPYATTGAIGTGPGYLIPSLMHPVDISTKRTKIEGGGSYIFMPGWEVKFSAQEEKKDGAKLTGFAFASASTAAMLVEPIGYKTNNFNLSLSYKGDKSNFDLTYLYSTFSNDFTSWTAQTPFATGSVLNNQGLFSSAPENQMHQLKLAGGYRFDPKTRLSYSLGTSRMTQDSAFNCQTGATGCVSGVNSWTIPVSSPNAKVVNDTAFIKLSSREFKNLALNASYKYDNRDNQTPVNTFRVTFADATGAASSTIANDPINIKRQLISLDAEYAISRGQALKASYDQEQIERTNDGSGISPSKTAATAGTIDFTLPVHNNKEDTLGLEYRNSLIEDLTTRLAYSYSQRRAQDYQTPSLTDTTNVNTITNAYYRNFRTFFVADRNRDKLRASANYQISNAWGVGFSADYNNDSYNDAALKESTSTILNFDLTFTPNEDLSFNPFYTYEDRKSKLTGIYVGSSTTNNTTLNGGAALVCSAVAPCILENGSWALTQADRVDTLGLAVKYRATPKLDLKGDLLYIRARTPISASGSGSVISNGATVPNYVSVPATDYPEIYSKTIQLRVAGLYKLDKQQSVRVMYMYQKLSSSDWQYDAYINPVAMQSFIGTGMTSPNFTENAVGVSYLYSFK